MNEKQFHFDPSALQVNKKKKRKGLLKKKGNYEKNPIRLIIWGAIIVFILSGVFATINANKAIREVSTYKKKITDLESGFEKLSDNQNVLLPETNAVLKRFLTLYFTIPLDKDKQDSRLSQLEAYDKTLNFRLINQPKQGQSIVALENYGYKENDGILQATYYLKTQSDSGQISESFVTVRFSISEKGYTILSLPIQLAYNPETWIAHEKTESTKIPKKTLDDKEATSTIKTFVAQFLKEYQDNNKENLNYLMKTVQGLPKGWYVESKELAIYGEVENPVVTTTIQLTQESTGIVLTETVQMYLTLTKDGKYFIEKLTYE